MFARSIPGPDACDCSFAVIEPREPREPRERRHAPCLTHPMVDMPVRTTPPVSLQLAAEAQTLRRLVRDEGLAAQDFVVEEDDSAAAFGMFGMVGSLRRVKRVSTQETRIYSVDRNRRWLQAFLLDLRNGYFSAEFSGLPRRGTAQSPSRNP